MLITETIQTRNQFVFKDQNTGVELWLKREDEIHPAISGNKFRKLKYNILKAKAEAAQALLTFGGAFSNHIAATATASKMAGIPSIGIIRGEELGRDLEKTLNQNQTLKFAYDQGMELYFVSRSDYRKKDKAGFLNELKLRFGNIYVIPEGGQNTLAVKGCEEILTERERNFDYICLSLGTGTTFSGVVNSCMPFQKAIGFPALKGNFLGAQIQKWTRYDNWHLIDDFHFGGFAKVNSDLIRFINGFYQTYRIPLDPIYTGKMIYGLNELITAGYFPEQSKVLAIHTGGLQGVSGINARLKQKKAIQIDFRPSIFEE